jgi:hypothetical protein
MDSKRHTFLFYPGTWIATGTYSDNQGKPVESQGKITIIHHDEVWLHDGSMKVYGENPVEFANHYEVVPFGGDGLTTTWCSRNPSLGTLYGVYAVVGDSILSAFSSEDGVSTGMEYLRQIETNQYDNRGVLFHEGLMLSSWAMELKLQEGDSR